MMASRDWRYGPSLARLFPLGFCIRRDASLLGERVSNSLQSLERAILRSRWEVGTSKSAQKPVRKFVAAKDAYNLKPEIWTSIGNGMTASSHSVPTSWGDPLQSAERLCHQFKASVKKLCQPRLPYRGSPSNPKAVLRSYQGLDRGNRIRYI